MMPETPYGLGRRHAPDPRDRLYPAQLVLDRMSPKRRTVPWRRLRVLDQKSTGTCVGHGWRGWFEGEPTMHKPDEGRDAFAIYRQAILLDEWPDNDGEETKPNEQLEAGSSVRAGAKAMQQDGYIGSYVWATTAAQIADFVTRVDGSPVVLGTSWMNAMFSPDPKTGLVKVTGGVAGGHCYVTDWFDFTTRRHRCYTSWGDGFGQKDADGVGGIFWLATRDLDRLLRNQGEACCGVEMVLTPTTEDRP
jgi:hypothetical protein